MLVIAKTPTHLELFEQTLTQMGQKYVKSIKRKSSRTHILVYLDHDNQTRSGYSEWIFNNYDETLIGKSVMVVS